MNSYLVILLPDSSIASDKVKTTFPQHYEVLPDQAWAVGSDLLTCADVCEAIGIGPDEHENTATGVVLRITESNGFAPSSLWEKLRAWERYGR